MNLIYLSNIQKS